MMKLTGKDLKTIITVPHAFKETEEWLTMLNREIDDLIMTHIKLVKMKNMPEIQITVDGLTAY